MTLQRSWTSILCKKKKKQQYEYAINTGKTIVHLKER